MPVNHEAESQARTSVERLGPDLRPRPVNWEQLRTILWLRWRLTRNQLARAGKVGAALSVLFVVFGVLVVMGGAAAGFLVGALALDGASPAAVLYFWDALVLIFLGLWTIGLLVEIQRSETIDVGRLLHLPVSLPEVFVFNYVASHLSLSLIFCVPLMLGGAIGLAVSRGPAMLLLVPLVLAFLFAVTSWTYYLRGWLVTLMVNKRTRRALVTGIGAVLVLAGQLPNLYVQLVRPHRPSPVGEAGTGSWLLSPAVLAAHHYLPPLWPGDSARALARSNLLPVALETLGVLALGAFGLVRAHRSTLRFYQGGSGDAPRRSARVTARAAPAAASARRRFLERELPWVPAEASALALASLRSLLRAPEVKMMLAAPVVAILVLGAMLGRSEVARSEMVRPFLATSAVTLALLGMIRLLANQFGFDRDGFRALVLLPAPRRLVLLAKNLAVLPLAAAIAGTYLLVLRLLAQLPLLVVLTGAVQFAAGFVLLGMLGNFFSIVAPYRMNAGSLRPTKTSTKTTLLIVACHLLVPTLMLAIFVPPAAEALCRVTATLPGVPVSLLLSLVVLAGAGLAYRLSLGPLGDLLERREQEILLSVTQAVE